MASKEVALLNRAQQALAKIKTVREGLEVRRQAGAAAAALKKLVGARPEIEKMAHEAVVVRIKAEERIGQLLEPGKEKRGGAKDTRATLPDGISLTQSQHWQNLARLRAADAEQFDAVLASPEPTTAELIRRYGRMTRDTPAEPPPPAEGTYRTIVVDPPWPMKKIHLDADPRAAGLAYPVMSLDQIREMGIPAADDCHLFLWTTHKFLPDALGIVAGWDFRYVCTFVWHKPGGYQPIGLPQYNCEFCLYARRGAPSFVETKAFSTCFEAPRGGHSEKPEAFYDLLRRVTAEGRLDMFNRRAIEGFDGWGDQAAK